MAEKAWDILDFPTPRGRLQVARNRAERGPNVRISPRSAGDDQGGTGAPPEGFRAADPGPEGPHADFLGLGDWPPARGTPGPECW